MPFHKGKSATPFVDYLIVVLIASTILPGEIYVLLSFVLLYLHLLNKNDFKISKVIFAVFFLFIIASLSTWLNLFFSDLNPNELKMVTFRFRKFFIEFIIAFSVYIHIKNLSLERISKILLVSISANIIVGVFQFVLWPGQRVSMLFFEPSSAAYFLLIFIIPCLMFVQINLIDKKVFFLFIFSGLLILSKALILISIFTYFLYILFSKGLIKKVIVYSCFFLITVFVLSRLQALMELSDQFKGFALMVTSLSNHGMTGLSQSNGVYGTYVTRFSSIISSIYIFQSEPFGIGFGAFGYLYEEALQSLGLYKVVSGDEVDAFLAGLSVPSPKSNLLEIALSTGWMIIPILFYIYNRAFKYKSTLVKISFLLFILSSFLIELNNFYLYLVVTVFFAEKNIRERCL